jgi:hypothetical protein
VALHGWRLLKKPSLGISLLEAGTALNRHGELLTLFTDPSVAGELKPLEESPYYWTLLSGVYKGSGKTAESLRCYREALRRSPGDGALAGGYIWLLMELDRRKELREALQSWQGRESASPELNEPFGAAYSYLGEYPRALRCFQARYREKHGDPDWLAAYADALELTGSPESAFLERLRALHITRLRMKDGGDAAGKDRKEFVKAYARLAMRMSPGDTLDAMMRKIARAPQDDVTRELVAAWAVSTERSDSARLWFWRRYAAMAKRPRWIELSLALEINDTTTIARLLRYDLERLPHRDAIEASLRAGQRELSEQLAFEWAEKNPADHLLYEQIREIYGTHPSFIRDKLTLSDRGGIGITENTLSLSLPVTRRWTLLIEGVQTVYGTLRSGVLGKTPGVDGSGGIGLRYLMEKGEVSLIAGGRNALESFPFVIAGMEYRPANRWRVSAGLHYSDKADETVPLRIGGTKDMAELSLEYRLTRRDTVNGRISVFSFHDQERRRLGGGESLETEYSHLFNFSYPDFRGRVFGGYNAYNRGGTPQGALLTLIPPGRSPDDSFFVPKSFGQAGFGISCGQGTRYSYLKEWRVFGSADFLWNSRTSAGWRYEVGVHGPLFGLDKLYFTLSQDSGSYGLSDMNTTLGMGYLYHMN